MTKKNNKCRRRCGGTGIIIHCSCIPMYVHACIHANKAILSLLCVHPMYEHVCTCIYMHTWHGSRPARSSVVVAIYKYTQTTEILWRKRDSTATLKRRAPWPLPWQAFIVFLGPLHQRWPSFTMHRFVLGGYLLQTKKRMSLNTSKKDICNVKGEVVKMVMLHTWKV